MTTKKTLRCGTVFPGCNFVIHGDSEAAVLAKLQEHAHGAHEMDHLSEALKQKAVASMAKEA